MSCLVVIVNYRTPELVVDCLESLVPEAAAVGEVSVTVVDAASGDDSLAVIGDAIEKHGWRWATLVSAERNGGFAYGNNIAIQPALASSNPPDFVWLLNPDTVVKPGALRALLEVMDAQPTAGIVGSRLEGPDGTTQTAAFRFLNILSEFDAGLRLGVVSRLLERWLPAHPDTDQLLHTDWVSGASMLIRSQVFEAIGLLDDQYFLFFEEVDFCLRAHRAGWSAWFQPESRVIHLEGQSTGLGERTERKPGYWFDSRRRYFEKNHGRPYALAADLSFIVGYSLWRAHVAIRRGPHPVRSHVLRDLIRRSFKRS